MTEPPTSPGLKRVIPRRPLGGCSSLHHLPDPVYEVLGEEGSNLPPMRTTFVCPLRLEKERLR